MTPDPSPSITRLSRTMARLVTVALVLAVPSIVLYVLLLHEQLPYHSEVTIAGFTLHALSPLASVAVMGALLVVALPLLWGLWELRGLFQGYAAGAIFTVDAAGHLRRCGYALMALSGKTLLRSLALSAALSIDRPKGERSMVLAVSSDDLLFLLLGVTVLVIARVMAEAAHLAEDNAGFV